MEGGLTNRQSRRRGLALFGVESPFRGRQDKNSAIMQCLVQARKTFPSTPANHGPRILTCTLFLT